MFVYYAKDDFSNKQLPLVVWCHLTPNFDKHHLNIVRYIVINHDNPYLNIEISALHVSEGLNVN